MMIVDKNDKMGEHAWTKLLDDKENSNNSSDIVVVKMTNSDNYHNSHMGSIKNLDSETSPLTVSTETSATITATNNGHNSILAGHQNVITIDTTTAATKCELNTDNNGVNVVADNGLPLGRKESIFGTFHRHLRRSLKAVSESPGPITR